MKVCTLTHVKLLRAHNLIVESADAVTIHLSIGENLTHQMPLLCPLKTPICSPDLSFAT